MLEKLMNCMECGTKFDANTCGDVGWMPEENHYEPLCESCCCDEKALMESTWYEMPSDEYFTRDDPFATKEINTVHQDEQFDASEDYMWNEELPFQEVLFYYQTKPNNTGGFYYE